MVLKFLSIIAFGVTLATSATSATLLSNGDFEAGNTGFVSDYAFKSGLNSNAAAAEYTVGTDPKDFNSAFTSFGDHTSGSGNMMIINGATSAGDTVWSETVSVAANSTYTFDGWIASVFSSAPGMLALSVNGDLLGTVNAPATTGVWDMFSYDWLSGASTTAVISLVQTSGAFVGNDYALDDLSFSGDATMSPIPLPAAGWLLLGGLAGLAGFGRRRRSSTV